jgi:hypothetical protein
MGPYVVAGSLLSSLSLINAIPWLLLYNLIFILPMIIITLIVYFGYSNLKYGEFVKSFDGNPCFACGYTYGMKCEYVYFESYNKLNSSDKFL